MIPIFGCFIGRRAGRGVWLGAAIALAGIFVLSGKQDASFMIGDLLIFICAVLWAFYFMLVGERVRKSPPLPLAVVMFLFCGAGQLHSRADL
jgi:drug/metabolite transporter (DMT)-like permease